MRLGVLDCFAGISGDMFLGALLGAGVPPAVLQGAASALGVEASLAIETVDRSGISAVKVHVLERGHLAEDGPRERGHGFISGSESSADEQPRQTAFNAPLSLQPKTQHQHKTGHAHTHVHEHSGRDAGHAHEPAHHHGRSLTEIRALIEAAALDAPVKQFAIRTFELLGAAEAKVHNVPIDTIHFHEVGAVDAIVDIVAASAGIHHLAVDAWHCSPINLGAGMVQCAHGLFPVPAPATAELLRDMPTYTAHVEQELVTPTGAALLRALQPNFGAKPVAAVQSIGYGAGTHNPPGFPNVLRLSLAEAAGDRASASGGAAAEIAPAANSETSSAARQTQTVTVLETALDDLSPQVIGYVAEQARAAGALDVMLTSVVMKKGRPGTLVTVLCDPGQSGALQDLLLRETTTLGVRVRQEQRLCLDRRHTSVATVYGAIRVKVGEDGGTERNAVPEFEDCRSAAEQHGVPLKLVQAAAMAAYLEQAKR